MSNKSEINLNSVSESGEVFKFSSSDINEIESLEKVIISDDANSIAIKVLPIGDTHFEVRAQIHLRMPLNCSKCGEGFENWFSEEAVDYLSLEINEEGEDKGFLLVDPKWQWPSFVVESVELETPYQNYKYGEKCLTSCPHYDNAVKNGWITQTEAKPNAFQALEKLKNKFN